MIRIVRIQDELPAEFETLRAEASAEGWGHLDRLADLWASGELRFDQPGEALMAAYVDVRIAGVGGVCVEPNPADGPARRLRRFYVRADFRGRGVARRLAQALMAHGLAAAPMLTVHAGREGASRFWEHMGFLADDRHGWSHSLRP